MLAQLQSDNGPKSTSDGGYRRCLEMTFESRLQIVDQNLLKRWQPKIPVAGMRHINAALDSGRGAILWISPFAFSDLVVKMGLAQAGYGVSHLSRPEHGFSESAFGMAVLNRLRTRVEDRYLQDRVRIDANSEKRAMLSLRRIIKNNGIVGITVGSQTKNPHRLSLGHGELPIAIGAIRLALLAKAPLLPVFGVKTADMAYQVHVESPINADGGGTESTLRQYADVLQQYIDRYPYQYRGLGNFTAPGVG
jgi:lauroyl/myristoyl acyltransferase